MSSKVLFKKKINKDELEERNLNINWWLLFGLICLFAFITRIHKIEEPGIYLNNNVLLNNY